MIRAFYKFNPIPSAVPAPSYAQAVNHEHCFIKSVKNASNGAAICIDPYMQLKRGVVFNKGCYSHLRSVSCYSRNDLFSSAPKKEESRDQEISLIDCLKCEKSIIETLLKEIENRGDIIECLQYAHVGKPVDFYHSTAISTRCMPDRPEGNTQWSGLILLQCYDEIIRSSHQLVNPELQIMSDSISDTSSEGCEIVLKIKHAEINKYTLNCIFKSLNAVFNRDKTSAKFLVALVAIYLKAYWCKARADNMTMNHLSKCVSQYPELFSTGKLVFDILIRDSREIVIDKKYSPCLDMKRLMLHRP